MTGRRPWPHVYGTLIWLKRPLYWLGLRPKAGSILHSPSLALVFGWYDAERAAPLAGVFFPDHQSVTIDVGPTMD